METENTAITIFWFRRDLRLEDNHGFFHALRQPDPVLPVFIFDTLILKDLADRRDKRIAFIHQRLEELSRALQKRGSTLYTLHAEPGNAFRQLLTRFSVARVITNEDYEPYAIVRDKKVREMLASESIPFHTFKDQVIFDPTEIGKADGTPYQVYTPYGKEWKGRLGNTPPAVYPSENYLERLLQHAPRALPSLKDLGFEEVEPGVAPLQLNPELLRAYSETRNLPWLPGTSHASPHLRFGTISIRRLVGLALEWSESWLNELIWREFFMMILYHFPQVVDRAFRAQYDKIEWRNNETEFLAWSGGNTGFPLVDAGIRQLNTTGWMHNRVRMVVASFLTKHLLIDWRWGEAYFAEKLLDYELSSNNGNWQWAAGCGCDAAPYFRIFNPSEQARKFDPSYVYIKTWIPDYPASYPQPMVDHAFARQRALSVYKKAVG